METRPISSGQPSWGPGELHAKDDVAELLPPEAVLPADPTFPAAGAASSGDPIQRFAALAALVRAARGEPE